MSDHFDTVIAGASFAGLACAKACALRGLNTLVIERKTDPGLGIHTTGLLVKEVADIWDIPHTLTRAIPKVRLYAPNLQWIDLQSPGYYFLATDMPNLMRWCSEQARQAGASVRLDSPFRQATAQASGWRLEPQAVETRFLIGADGARSAVAKQCGLDSNQRFLVGTETEFTGVKGLDPECLHVFIDYELAPGYIAWVIPGCGVTQVGLAARQGHRVQLQPFLEKIRDLFDFETADIVARRGGLIPVGRPLKRFYNENTLLLGDAAGWVSPLTAGGINMALQHGRQAGVYLADHLQHQGGHPGQRLAKQLPRYFWKGLMRRAANCTLPNSIFNRILFAKPLRHIAQTIFYHNRGLFSFQAWQDALRG